MNLLRSSLALMLASACVGGCAYRVPPTTVPADIQGRLTVLPTDITMETRDGEVDARTMEGVREDTARILTSAHRGDAQHDNEAKVRVHIELGERHDATDALQKDGIAIMGLWPALLGMVIEEQKLKVDVVVESRGHTFEGHGSADKLGGVYASARRRALAVAINQALDDAGHSAD